jgi:hypothetical protein
LRAEGLSAKGQTTQYFSTAGTPGHVSHKHGPAICATALYWDSCSSPGLQQHLLFLVTVLSIFSKCPAVHQLCIRDRAW